MATTEVRPRDGNSVAIELRPCDGGSAVTPYIGRTWRYSTRWRYCSFAIRLCLLVSVLEIKMPFCPSGLGDKIDSSGACKTVVDL
jgi:hypothetical protein